MRVDRIERGEDLSVTRLPSVKILDGDRLVGAGHAGKAEALRGATGATLHQEEAALEVGEEPQHLAQLVVTGTRSSTGQPTGHPLSPSAPGCCRWRCTGRGTRNWRKSSAISARCHCARATCCSCRHGGPVSQLKRAGTALVLDGTTDLPRTRRAPRAMLIMALVILAAATGALPIEAASVAGVALMLGSRCLRWGDASGALSPTVIMIIVASLALGVAMIETDGALYLAQVLVQVVEGLPHPPDTQLPDAGDGDPHQHHLQQRHRGHRRARRHPNRQRTGRLPGAVRVGGDLRRQYELRDALRLQDQHPC